MVFLFLFYLFSHRHFQLKFHISILSCQCCYCQNIASVCLSGPFYRVCFLFFCPFRISHCPFLAQPPLPIPQLLSLIAPYVNLGLGILSLLVALHFQTSPPSSSTHSHSFRKLFSLGRHLKFRLDAAYTYWGPNVEKGSQNKRPSAMAWGSLYPPPTPPPCTWRWRLPRHQPSVSVSAPAPLAAQAPSSSLVSALLSPSPTSTGSASSA